MNLYRNFIHYFTTVIAAFVLLQYISCSPQNPTTSSVQGRYLRPSYHNRDSSKCPHRCRDSADKDRGGNDDEFKGGSTREEGTKNGDKGTEEFKPYVKWDDSTNYKPKDERDDVDEYEPKDEYDGADDQKPKIPINGDYNPKPINRDVYDIKPPINDDYKPKPSVAINYNPSPPIGGGYNIKPVDEYKPKPPIRFDYNPKPDIKDEYEPKPVIVDDGYKPKPPVRVDYNSKPIIRDEYKPKPDVIDDYKPESPVPDSYDYKRDEKDEYKPQPAVIDDYKPKQPVIGDYQPHPPVIDNYKPQPPVIDDFKPKPPVIDDYKPQPAANDGYKPKPPLRVDYNSKPIVRDEYVPQPAVVDDYKPKPPVRTDYNSRPISKDEYDARPISTDSYKPKPPAHTNYDSRPVNRGEYDSKPTSTDRYQPKPPNRDDYNLKPAIDDTVPKPPSSETHRPVGGGYYSGYPAKKDNDDDYKIPHGGFDNSKDDSDYGKLDDDRIDGHPIPVAEDSNCICVPYYQCSDGHIVTDGAGIIDARRRKHPDDELPLDGKFKPPSCGPFHVCCNTPESSTVKPYEHRCGVRNPSGINSRILSPSNKGEADFGEWPWQAAVLKSEGTVNIFQCGGVLIDKYHVLTVAHCVFHLYKYNDYPLKVRLGEWDTQTTSEFLAHEDYKVSKITIHPEYRNTSLWNDVAILRLQDPVLFAPHIDTVCLPKYDENFAGQNCVVTGWGKDSYKGGTFSNVMKEVALQVIDNYYCEEMLRKTRLGRFFQLHEGFVCAGGEHGLDSCKGDGGGPLVCYRKDRSYALAGLVSWGIDCGQPGVPGVYVKVQRYLDWISKNTGVPVQDYWPKH